MSHSIETILKYRLLHQRSQRIILSSTQRKQLSTTDKKDREPKKEEKKVDDANIIYGDDDDDAKVERKVDRKETEIPPGQLKDFSKPMSSGYSPNEVEPSWDSYWEACGFYKPDDDIKSEINQSFDNKFVIVIPPPNVTGTLHLGHALTCSIEDAIVRWHRMSGRNVLWVPGTDHAGIATQAVVEKKLAKEGKPPRHMMRRDEFLKEVWNWKNKSGSRIYEQIRRLGASVDWSREAFTMDEPRSRAVTEAFVCLHSDGLIYRDNRLVSWSCALRTAISAIEVNYVELEGISMRKVPGYKQPVEFGALHSFAYKFEGSNDEIVVATTRLETMLGDVAVAVHPDDERYKKYHGRSIVHPFIPNRKMILICDAVLVDMKFGTGAVKITPAHDPNDYECGKRNKLEQINIFDDAGNINENGGKFKGMKRFDAREAILKELETLKLYRGKKSNPMKLALCSRSQDVIEPVIRPQWWVKCETMAKQAIESVRNGELKIIPKDPHEQTFYRWMEDIQDWCISRQLWWGHRIPAYFVSVKGKPKPSDTDEKYWVVARTLEDAKKIAKERFKDEKENNLELTQDEDVLDTWFSSGIFPFSVCGWPEKTKDMNLFYPGHLLETGHDILFFWVARMVMMGLQLTKQLPFKTVYLHAMVRDKFGRKMSKSLGNVIDPIDVIEGITLEELHEKLRSGNLDPAEVNIAIEGQKRDFPEGIKDCGADALRFGLLNYTAQGININLDVQRIFGYRLFCNKLWNAVKFALIHFPPNYLKPQSHLAVKNVVGKSGNLTDRWILSSLRKAVIEVDEGFKEYDFYKATTAIYNFWYYQLCDVYLESIKPIMKSNDEAKKASSLATLHTCLDIGLRLMHPMMPFVTEELYHRLPGAIVSQPPYPNKLKSGSIMVQPFPRPENVSMFEDAESEQQMNMVNQIAHTSRSARNHLNTQSRINIKLFFSKDDEFKWANSFLQEIKTLSFASEVTVVKRDKDSETKAPPNCIIEPVNATIDMLISLEGRVDVCAELVKMEKKEKKLVASTTQWKGTLSKKDYQEKTKPAVKEKNQKQFDEETEELSRLQASITQFKSDLSPTQWSQYYSLKIRDAETEIEKLKKNLEKLNAKLPKDPTKEKPKKTLSEIADTEKEIESLKLSILSFEKQIKKNE